MSISFRITTALLLAISVLIGLTATVQATARQSTPIDQPALADPIPTFLRIVTITIEPSADPLTTAYTSYWETESFSQVLGSYVIPLPPDATEVDVRLTQGSYVLITDTNAITIQITGEQPWFYFAYRTQLRALRTGHQILIQQSASNNLPYRYQGTVIFSAPQQYVGTLGVLPQTVDDHQARWDIIPPRVEIQPGVFRYRFNNTSWWADSRLDWPDLAIISTALSINRASLLPEALVTVTLFNSSTITTSAPVYLNLYDRLAPALAPSGPLDLAGGWCGEDVLPACPAAGSFTNPVTLGPTQLITLNARWPLTRSGLHEFHLQIDAFGSSIGFNAESNEANNLIRLGEARIARLFLPIIRR